MKKAIKDLKRGIEAKEDPKVLMWLLSTAYSEIDKAKKRNIINKNNAARKKSRLNAMVKLGVVR